MPLDGNGTYTAPSPEFPAVANNTILAPDFNTIILDIAAALDTAFYRDGQAAMTASANWGGFDITNIDTIQGQTAGLAITEILSLTPLAAGCAITGNWSHAGTETFVTQVVTDDSTKVATTAFVQDVAMTAALPSQAGNSGKLVQTDGTTATWGPLTTAQVSALGTAQVLSLSVAQASALKTATGAVSVSAATAPTTGQVLQATSATTATWQTLDLAGGATITSSATDITLTASSSRVQSVAMTAASKGVILPDATTLSEGGPIFVVKNSGDLAFTLKDSTSAPIVSVATGVLYEVYLTDNSTAAGTWTVNAPLATYSTIVAGTAISENATANTANGLCKLTRTKALHVPVEAASDHMKARVLTVTGNVITAGTAFDYGAITTTGATDVDVCRMSDTQAIAVYQNLASIYPCAVILNISGDTVTAGTELVLNTASASGGAEMRVVPLTATTALAFYKNAGNLYSVVLTVADSTTLTKGSAVQVTAVATTSIGAAMLTSTLAVATYRNGTDTFAYSIAMTISGTTITMGSAVALSAVASNYTSVCRMGDARALACHTNNSGYPCFRVLTITGSTTITANTQLTTNPGSSCSTLRLASFNARNAVVVFNDGNDDVNAQPINIAADLVTITAGTLAIVAATTASYDQVCALYDAVAVAVYRGVSTYTQAIALEAVP